MSFLDFIFCVTLVTGSYFAVFWFVMVSTFTITHKIPAREGIKAMNESLVELPGVTATVIGIFVLMAIAIVWVINACLS